MIGSLFLDNQPNQGVLVVNFFLIYYFSLFVPIFDLVDVVEYILLLLYMLRSSQDLLVKYE